MGFLQQASSALTPQSTYTAQVPNIQQQNLIPQINNSQAAIAQNQGAQNALAGQILAQSQGQGPNLAQMQLNAAQNQALQQQAGAVASQKGISPGLAQRQIAQQGAAAQQGNAQASAQMRAQQQLAAQGQLGGLYGQIGGQQLQNQGLLQGAQSAQNNAITQGTLGAEGVNAGVAMGNIAAQQQTQGMLLQGAGTVLGGPAAALTMAHAHGGMIRRYADGGGIDITQPQSFGSQSIATPNATTAGPSAPTIGGPQSQLGKSLAGSGSSGDDITPSLGLGDTYAGGYKPGMEKGQQAGKGMAKNFSNFGQLAGSGGASSGAAATSANLAGAGEAAGGAGAAAGGAGGLASLAPLALLAAKGGKINNFKPGGSVPGKASVKGDSYKNDTVPAIVSPGEIVLPRSVTQGRDPAGDAAKFVAAVLAHKGKKK